MVRSRWLAAFSARNVGSSISFFARLIDSEHDARPELAGQRHVLLAEDLLHQRLLVIGVVDDEPPADADRLAVAPEDARTERVERARLDVTTTLADEADDPLAELGGGLVRERDREDAERRDPLDADQIRDAVGEDTRLAGARTREDQQRSVGRGDGARLLRVEGSQDLCLALGASLGEDLGIGRRGQRCGRVALGRRRRRRRAANRARPGPRRRPRR